MQSNDNMINISLIRKTALPFPFEALKDGNSKIPINEQIYKKQLKTTRTQKNAQN